jgi:succinate-semialdehyde dehydrogenase / glutarate-semialdehyde dehydrogenase
MSKFFPSKRFPLTFLPRKFLRNSSTFNPSKYLKNSHLWNPSCAFINGKFIYQDFPEQFPVYNPANNQIIATYPKLKLDQVQPCEQVSFDAWKIWKQTTAKERSKILRKMSDLMHIYIEDLAHIITLEAGKPLAEARGEVLYAASFFEFYGEEAKRIYGEIVPPVVHGRKYLTMRQSVGPAAMITPWNFPSAMITRKVAPALAAGCTATIKPAEETPLSALAICAIANEAGLPPGVLNVVTVGREDVQAVGRHFCSSLLYRKISFTGSTNVGKWLMQESASTVKKLSLENGGNAPFIVFEDADLDLALKALLAAKFRNAGQTCVCANRIFVQDSIYEKFADMLTEKVAAYRCGDGLDPHTTMGPLINQAGLNKVPYPLPCQSHLSLSIDLRPLDM